MGNMRSVGARARRAAVVPVVVGALWVPSAAPAQDAVPSDVSTIDAIVGALYDVIRGINSIQLFHDGSRYWVVTVLWDSERPDNPIPPRYLGG